MAILFDSFYQPWSLCPLLASLHFLFFYTEALPHTGFRGGYANEGWGCLKLRHGKTLATFASWKLMEGPPQMLQLDPGVPLFLVSPTLLSGRARLIPTPGEGCWGNSHESKGKSEGNLSPVFPNRENTQAPGTQITDNC